MPGETGWQNCQDLPGRERVSGVFFGLGGHQRDLSKRLRIKLKWVLLGVAAWVPIKIWFLEKLTKSLVCPKKPQELSTHQNLCEMGVHSGWWTTKVWGLGPGIPGSVNRAMSCTREVLKWCSCCWKSHLLICLQPTLMVTSFQGALSLENWLLHQVQLIRTRVACSAHFRDLRAQNSSQNEHFSRKGKEFLLLQHLWGPGDGHLNSYICPCCAICFILLVIRHPS